MPTLHLVHCGCKRLQNQVHSIVIGTSVRRTIPIWIPRSLISRPFQVPSTLLIAIFPRSMQRSTISRLSSFCYKEILIFITVNTRQSLIFSSAHLKSNFKLCRLQHPFLVVLLRHPLQLSPSSACPVLLSSWARQILL